MGDGQRGFDALLRQARADPDVVGVVLTGSHALGLAGPWSDYDVRVILCDEVEESARTRYLATAIANVDLRVMCLREFVAYAEWNSPTAWDRYSFAHAQVLAERGDVISAPVAEKGRIPAEEQSSFVRSTLDAFINSAFRALKCVRKGNALCARLEASEAVQHGLDVIFALEGRVKPYPVALAHELREYPLQAFATSGNDLLLLIAAIVERGDVVALQHLLSAILDHSRGSGHEDVIDAWGADIAWMKSASAITDPSV